MVMCQSFSVGSLKKDDLSEEEIIGTKDGSIRVISLNEKAWLAQQNEGIFEGKVLFIGDVYDRMI